MSVAIIFPGQGTQQSGMASAWRDHPSWWVVERAEAALGEPLGHLVTDAPPESLTRTREAQLAVLVTSLVAWDALRPLADAVVAFAGHSLGQVTALIASGALDLDDGVRFAARRAELTQAAADAHPGRMAALLGATQEQAEEACSAAPDGCWVANDNAPGQVVIAGTPDGVDAASMRAKQLGVKRVTLLNVGGAFHTPLMQDATDGLVTILADVPLSVPSSPVVSNGDARAYSDADGWRTRLAEHVSVPVRWRSTMDTLVSMGATNFFEVGYGSMLAALAKRGAPAVTVRSIGTPDDVPAHERTAQEVG
ncbi:MAG: ACP S-malonyltransferase [Acidimicrobiia bacterium]